ncbi:MAG: hypothetical protein R3A51_04890 [Nannocystaceae bacterium]|nr:hypothetical protein [Myxococcales bacterium]
MALPLLVACASSGPPPPANPGSEYVVKGKTVHYDSGCEQESPTGRLVKGQRFKLIEERDGCWLIEFKDQTETYIRPTAVAPAP